MTLLAACQQSEGPASDPNAIGPGDAHYIVSYAGGAAPVTTWTGTAKLNCSLELAAEVSATSTAPGSDAWWSLVGGMQARAVGTHPIAGYQAPGDTIGVWWGHLVSGDRRIHGTLTIRLATPERLDAHFSYTGPAGVGTDTVMATVQGDFSALLPPYVNTYGC